jgi:maltose alpha-D-glucosyltransferase/alpha-amylase
MNYLSELLQRVYPEKVSFIIDELKPLLNKSSNHQQKMERDSFNLYVTYADSFQKQEEGGFPTLIDQVGNIRELGFNAIHVLPFLNSPMIDYGFDVSDYYQVRSDLGGENAFDKFVDTAHANGMRIFMDLVLNHVSDQHDWFLRATSGDQYYRDFFITTNKKPVDSKQFKDETGVWSQHEFNGNLVKVRQFFPEQTKEIPNWVEGVDGYWYYHSFYPHQLDLNWDNENLYIEMAKVLIYWANKGLSFRLDAIPFLGKDFDIGQMEGTDKTHNIVKSLHEVMKLTDENGVFLVEAFQGREETIEYFGQQEEIESELAYDFELMAALWSSLVLAECSFVWEAIEKFNHLPKWATMITFLRNHDDLTLEFMSADLRDALYPKLVENGLPFRNGLCVSGRTYSLLNESAERLLLGYLFLVSLPGNPSLIFGDEYAQTNDLEFMHETLKRKVALIGDSDLELDTRDINRSPIVLEEVQEQDKKEVFAKMSDIFNARLGYNWISKCYPQRIDVGEAAVFAAKYQYEDKILIVVLNLCAEEVVLQWQGKDSEVLSINGAAIMDGNLTMPAYSGIWLTAN